MEKSKKKKQTNKKTTKNSSFDNNTERFQICAMITNNHQY